MDHTTYIVELQITVKSSLSPERALYELKNLIGEGQHSLSNNNNPEYSNPIKVLRIKSIKEKEVGFRIDGQDSNDDQLEALIKGPDGQEEILDMSTGKILELWGESFNLVSQLSTLVGCRVIYEQKHNIVESNRYSYIMSILDAYYQHSVSFFTKLAKDNGYEVSTKGERRKYEP